MSWGPLLVPGLLYSPANENLSFFLGSFEVVDGVFFLPLLVAPSLEAPQRFRPVSAGDRNLSGLRAGGCGLSAVAAGSCSGTVGRLSSPPSGVADGDVSVPLMLCASTGIYFLSVLASSRLSFV